MFSHIVRVLILSIGLSAGIVSCGKSADRPGDRGGDPPPAQGNAGHGGSPESKVKIRIQGSDTMLQMCTSWAGMFRKNHPEAAISILGGGSGIGISGLIEGSCDIASASRRIKRSESEKAAKKSIEISEIEVGRDGITIVVNKGNQVSSMTQDQVFAVFSGKITNWSEVGGNDEEIIVLTRDKDSGTYGFFKEHFLGETGFADTAQVLASNSAIVDTVAEASGAVGYVGLGHFEEAKALIKALAISEGGGDAVMPSVESVRDGSYPVSRALYFYLKSDAGDSVRAFIDYARSVRGQQVVTENGFVPVK